MIVNSFILAVSVGLFLYWFRYTCVLMLSARTTKDFGAEVAAANRLGYVEFDGRIGTMTSSELEAVHRSLQRDYRLVSALLRQAGEWKVGGNSLEDMMLRADFQLMKLAYGVSRRVSDARARSAVKEMTQIVAHMANAFGEQASSSARA